MSRQLTTFWKRLPVLIPLSNLRSTQPSVLRFSTQCRRYACGHALARQRSELNPDAVADWSLELTTLNRRVKKPVPPRTFRTLVTGTSQSQGAPVLAETAVCQIASEGTSLAVFRQLLNKASVESKRTAVQKETVDRLWTAYSLLLGIKNFNSEKLTVNDFASLLQILESRQSKEVAEWTQIIRILHDMKQAKLKPTIAHYEAAISGYGETNQWSLAEDLFREVEAVAEESQQPLSLQTFHRFLDACLACEKLDAARDVLSRYKGMLMPHEDPLNVDYCHRLVVAYVGKGHVMEAMNFLEEMKTEKSVRLNAKMASAIVWCYSYLIKHTKLRPDAVKKNLDIVSVVDVTTPSGINKLLLAFSYTLKYKIPGSTVPLPPVLCSNVGQFVQMHVSPDDLFNITHLTALCNTLRSITSCTLPLTPRTYNRLLGAYVDAGDFSTAVLLIEEMLSCLPDTKTQHQLLNRYALRLDLPRLEQLYRRLVCSGEAKSESTGLAKRNKMNTLNFNVFLHGFARYGATNLAAQVFKDMKTFGILPDSYTYTFMIQGYVKRQNTKKAWKWLQTLRNAKNVEVNVAVYHMLMRIWAGKGHWVKVVQIFDKMKSEVHHDEIPICPDKAIFDMMLTALSQRSNWARYEEVLKEMLSVKAESMTPDADTFRKVMNVLLNMGSEHKEVNGSKVLRAFEIWKRYCKDENVNLETYNRLIEGLARRGDLLSANEVYKGLRKSMQEESDMKAWKVTPQPDMTTYKTLILYAAANKNMKMAQKVYEDLITAPSIYSSPSSLPREEAAKITNDSTSQTPLLKPDVAIFNALLNGYASSPPDIRALQRVYRSMLTFNISPNIVTFNHLIKGFVNARQMNSAKKVFDAMLQYCVVPDVVTVNTLLGGYLREQHWEGMADVVRDFRSRGEGMRLNVATLNVLVKAVLEAGMDIDSPREGLNQQNRSRYSNEKLEETRNTSLSVDGVWAVYGAVTGYPARTRAQEGYELKEARVETTTKPSIQGLPAVEKRPVLARTEFGSSNGPKSSLKHQNLVNNNISTTDSLQDERNPKVLQHHYQSSLSNLLFPFEDPILSAKETSTMPLATTSKENKPPYVDKGPIRPNKITYKLFIHALQTRGDYAGADVIIRDMRRAEQEWSDKKIFDGARKRQR